MVPFHQSLFSQLPRNPARVPPVQRGDSVSAGQGWPSVPGTIVLFFHVRKLRSREANQGYTAEAKNIQDNLSLPLLTRPDKPTPKTNKGQAPGLHQPVHPNLTVEEDFLPF